MLKLPSKLFKKFNSNQKLFFFIFLFCFSSYNLWRHWRPHPFTIDVKVYYSYIEATFIQKDLTFNSSDGYGINKTTLGKGIPKMSMGLALVYLPGFIICHLLSILLNYPIDGLSEIYAFGLYYYSILFVILGLFVLKKILIKYYPENVSNWVIISLFFGTNILYYTLGFNLMAHTFLFTLFSFILYYTIKWYETNKFKNIAKASFLCGLVTLVRPTSIFVIIIPLLFNIKNVSDFNQRISLFIKFKVQLIYAIFLFILPWIPQLLLWKVNSGSYILYSYGNESFDFSNPQIINVLFSFRKGWLLYTPIMIFALLGFYKLFQTNKGLFVPIFIYFVITFYVLSCWWCWSWGGAFSNRGLIESYLFLAFPMAAFFNFVQNSLKKIYFNTLLVVIILFNVLQTYQYSAVVIHWDNMSKRAYFYSLFKLKYTDDERKYFNTLLDAHSDSPEPKK